MISAVTVWATNIFIVVYVVYCIFICIINRMVFSISDLAYYCTYLIWNIVYICIINRMVFSISDLAYYCTYLIWNIVYIINKIIFIYNYRLPCFTKKVEKIKSTSSIHILQRKGCDILDTLQCICLFSISLDQVHWVLTPD